MNKKNLTLIIVLAFLALAAYLYVGPYKNWQGKRQTADARNWLAAINMSLVDKIAATDKDGKTHTLTKINNEWKTEPNNWPTEKIITDSLDEKLTNLTKDELEIASFNKDNKEKFDLTNNGLRVKLFQGDKEVGSFIIGKIGSDYASTYIGRSDDDRSYRAHDTYVRAFDVESWRDNTILNLETSAISAIEWQNAAGKLEITNQPDKRGETYWHASSTTVKLNKEKVEAFLNSVVKLEASDVPEQTIVGTELDKPTAQLSLMGQGIKETLILGGKKDSEYYLQKQSTGQIFLITEQNKKELEKQIKDFQ